ncbi:hypothetical protein FA95DRAFT_1683116 [Auriscalpium vulgare]|uniref:Uncharacterized protein n=1 Tax=Auriscalpium vulgare TaxID=40419 RepID=A0ACB8RBQ3_9AGAM|nr:hypothetical protein FA95DRAFT_1683116 [Auriscalpium vulgare]
MASSSITVKWGRERLQIPLPPPDTKLAVLRATLAEQTHLPPDGFKLIYAGAVMKDDNAPLSAYKLRPNTTMVLLDSSAPAASPAPAPRAPLTEASAISAFKAEVARVRDTLEPGVDALLRDIAPPPTPASADPTPSPAPTAAGVTPAQTTEHTRLGELLLQALLRLDAIPVESAWTDARAERKGAVRTVQGVLDRLDGAWRAAKAQR